MLGFSVNLGLVVTPLIFGHLKDSYPDGEHGYYYVTRLSVFLALMSLLVSIIIHYHDLWYNRGTLSLSVT